MKCQYCGNEVAPGSPNCPSCGAPSPQPAQSQQPIMNGSVGVQPAQPAQQPMANIPAGYEQKSRIAYIVLGLFLGCLGVHNFYAGYTSRGVIQLLITLLFGWWLFFPWIGVAIWSFIEICIVDKDANSVPMK